MNARPTALACVAGALALAACSSGPPDAGGLRESFARQIAAVDGVGDFEQDGSELAFAGPDGAGGRTAWLVSIDSAVVEPQDDEDHPYRGIVQSSWYADGRLIEPAGSVSHLPSDFLDAGIAQDCWGLWSAADGRWTW